jgi:hypothetical protein
VRELALEQCRCLVVFASLALLLLLLLLLLPFMGFVMLQRVTDRAVRCTTAHAHHPTA